MNDYRCRYRASLLQFPEICSYFGYASADWENFIATSS